MPKNYRDRDTLHEMYVESGMSTYEIASEFNVSDVTIGNWLERYNIERRSAVNNLEDGLATEFKDVLRGELLGDGSLFKNSLRSSGALFTYGTSRRKYRDWLATVFEEEGFAVNRDEFDISVNATDVEAKSYMFRTLVYAELGHIYDIWYPDGSKHLPDSFHLTPLRLRHWYIGDGSYSNGELMLCANGFTEEERQRMIVVLNDIGVKASTHSNGSIRIKNTCREQFFDYMKPLPSPLNETYGYKWPD